MYYQQRFKTQLFFFLFPVCLLQVIPKKEAPRSANFHFNFFFQRKHACHFHCPVIHPPIYHSISSSLSPSLPKHYFIIGVREEDRREEKERKRGRWPAFYLSVFLFVCLNFVQVWPCRKWPF